MRVRCGCAEKSCEQIQSKKMWEGHSLRELMYFRMQNSSTRPAVHPCATTGGTRVYTVWGRGVTGRAWLNTIRDTHISNILFSTIYKRAYYCADINEFELLLMMPNHESKSLKVCSIFTKPSSEQLLSYPYIQMMICLA